MYFTQAIKRAAQIAGDQPSTIYSDRKQCWRSTLERIQHFAGGIRALGVRDGARVAILAMNSDRYFEAMYAIAWAGGVFVPMNTRWSQLELSYAIQDCGAEIVLIDDVFADILADIGTQCSLSATIYMGDATVPAGILDYEEIITQSPACADAERHDDDPCGIFYTGGTTGHPKGVMLSNKNFIFASLNWLSCLHVSRETVYMHVAGFFHLGGSSPAFATTLATGTNVILPKFEPHSVMQTIECHRPNYVLLVPVMVNSLVNDPALAHHDLSSVQMCHYGGSPMPEAVLRKSMEKLPTWAFHQGYGQTELTALATTLDWTQHVVNGQTTQWLTSAGQVSPGWEIKIVSPDGRTLPCGEIGEIVFRGAGVMLGYWNRPDETRATIRDGWLYTGDVGLLDEDGFIFIMDRLKDMIISGGENIYSTEVENAIYKHPSVRECAVIGIPDDTWGETVHAVVVPHEGKHLSMGEIVAHCRELIAGYKCPRSVEVTTTSLPVSPAGKITKNVIRARCREDRAQRTIE